MRADFTVEEILRDAVRVTGHSWVRSQLRMSLSAPYACKIGATLFFMMLPTVTTFAQSQTCRFLCEPTLLIEPTITFEKDATVFETIFALDLSTPVRRVGITLEAITTPFSDENDVELESELKLYWLESEQTGGWL